MDWKEAWDAQIEELLPELICKKNEPLSGHTSFRIGGPAARMAFPESEEQLLCLMKISEDCGARPYILGNGTNVLAPDEGVDRLVVETSKLNHVAVDGTVLTAECGVSLAVLADTARKAGLTGLEFAHGIPGTLGGALCMNAGAYGGEMKDVVQSVTLLDPQEGIVTRTGEEMDFSYRHSYFSEHPDCIAVRAVLRLSVGDPQEIGAKMKELMDKRRASQPLELPSAGSTFKRPTGYFAGKLIGDCALSGARVGGAEVSAKHNGFVVNAGGATCADVLKLIEKIQETVFADTGVRLEPEVRLIGE